MWPTPKVARWTIDQARHWEPDFVLFGAPYPLPTLGPALRAELGVPYGVVAHGAEVTVPSAFPVTRQLLARPMRVADVVFSNSRYTTRKVESLTGRSVDYLGIGVDLDLFRPAETASSAVSEVVIGSVSRFVPRKQQLQVIEAADQLYRAGARVRVSIVGKGRLESRLREAADAARVPVDLHVDVPWNDLPRLYQEMDVFAVPTKSRWLGLEIEGLGIVYLEAAATALPVVAGTSGGSPETVRPGVTGYVVGTYDDLVEAMSLLVADEDRRMQMGAAGREFMVEHYSWDGVTERLMISVERAVKRAD